MSKQNYSSSDFWAKKAKKEGYAARSVFKLMELDKKFRLFRQGLRVLDVGAAPGSWSQWAYRQIGPSGFLAAVDLQDLRFNPPADSFFFIKGDIYDEEVRSTLTGYGPYDLIMSDAAPATSGHKGVDTDRSEALVETILDYADQMLKPGAAVLAKIFIGGGQKSIMDRMRKSYKTVRAFKPEACRSVSFETYLIGQGRL